MIDALDRMEITDGVRYGDKRPVGVELSDGPLAQPDNVAQMGCTNGGRFRCDGARQSPHREAVAVYQIGRYTADCRMQILADLLDRSSLAGRIADFKRNQGDADCRERERKWSRRGGQCNNFEFRSDEMREYGLHRAFAAVERCKLEGEQDSRDETTPVRSKVVEVRPFQIVGRVPRARACVAVPDRTCPRKAAGMAPTELRRSNFT